MIKRGLETRKMSYLVLIGALSSISIGTPAQAQTAAESEDIINMQTVTCRDLLKTDGDDQRNTIVFMHGYLNGKAGDSKIDGPELAETTDRIMDTCVDSPDRNLLSVFEENRSSSPSQSISEESPAPAQTIPELPVSKPSVVPPVQGLW